MSGVMSFEEQVKQATDAYLKSLGITPEVIRSAQSGLSVEEVRAIQEAMFQPEKVEMPDQEIDVECRFGKGYVRQVWRVWGRYVKGSPGTREIQPNESMFEIDRVCVGSDEITGSLTDDDLAEVSDYLCERIEGEPK